MKTVLAVYLVLALAFAVLNPEFEAPDENTHFFFAQHLGKGEGLPVQPLVPDERGPWEQEGSQPPLYYWMAAPLTRGYRAPRPEFLWFNHQNSMGHPEIQGNENRFVHPYPETGTGREDDTDARGVLVWTAYEALLGSVDPLLLTRVLSIALGLVTVTGAWLVARRVFPARPHLATAAAALGGLTPQFVYLSGAVTNDALVIALASMALALLLKVADDGANRRTVLVLAVVVGLAPLAKLSGLAVAGFSVATLVGLAIRRREPRLVFRAALPVAVAPMILSGWWYVRNIALYGEPTGVSRMLPGDMRRDFDLVPWLSGLSAELVGLWRSYWGLFGWFTLPMPNWAYAVIDVGVAAAVVGLALAVVRRAPYVRWGVVAWLGVWLVVVFASLLRWMTIAKGAQGRLLFPAIAAVAVLLAAGLRSLLPTRITDRAIAWGVLTVLAGLGAFAILGVVRPAYAKPAPLDSAPPSAQRVGARWAVNLWLEAADVPERVAYGEPLHAVLYWRWAAPAPEPWLPRVPGGAGDGWVATRLDAFTLDPGSGAERVGGSGPVELSYPGDGTLPPSVMVRGRVYADSRRVPPAPQHWALDQPTAERLSVHLYGPKPGQPDDPSAPTQMYRWPLAGSDTGEWSTFVIREPAFPTRRPEGPPNARFAGGIELWIARPDLEDSSTSCWGCFYPVWSSTAPVAEDLSAFIHFRDNDGKVVSQADRPPSDREYFPTRYWRAGDVVPGQPIEAKSVLIGLYDPVTGVRLPAFSASGEPLPDNALAVTPATGGPEIVGLCCPMRFRQPDPLTAEP